MKNTIKFIMALLIAGSTVFYSCETIELEQLANPNSLTPEQADPNLLLNSIQLAYLSNLGVFNNNGSNLTRIETFLSRDYFAGLTGLTLDATWSRTYATANGDTRGMIPNIQNITDLNTAAGDGSLNYQEGVAKALLAHNMMLLVDYVGDVPFSQANNPDEFPAPVADPGSDVYAAALSLLNEAEILLGNGVQGVDLFYNTGAAASSEPWIKFINTVRLKAALTVGDIATFDSIIATQPFISSTADDFQYQYITNDVNPDGRHPEYANDYTPSGANVYQSNWLMDKMQDTNDPRIRYYFFRQTDCTPGASCNPDPTGAAVTQLTCSIIEPPAHYVAAGFGDQFCFLENGYWGRPHGDDQGTPPDNFFRTASGVYPAGGLFDGDNFRNGVVGINDNGTDETSDDFFDLLPVTSDDVVGLGAGGGGAGIEPFILASQVDFMRAEVELTRGNDMGAAQFIRAGMEKSIAKVQSFLSVDPTFSPGTLLDGTDVDPDTGETSNVELSGSLIPTTAQNTAFIDGIINEFENGDDDDKFNILAEQYWVSQFGSGAETYNFYRRTGFPTTLTPNLEPNPGPFPRSFPYASGEVVANPNISQKADQNVQVFWDNNPPSAVMGGFPASN